ncbi:dihydrodipicolinate reductase [Nocardioides hungaricus]
MVYGAGAMGLQATRMMTEKGVDVVGAIARSPQKVGTDLGELAGIAPLGVLVESDAEHVIASRRPDIVLLATQSFIPEIFDQLAMCARHGVNVVTISEEALYPWNSSPALAAELDAIARAHDVTITGGGHQDSFWVHMVGALMGASHRIESVHGRTTWNADEYGADVIQSKHVGQTLDQFAASVAAADAPPTYGRNLLGALAQIGGFTPRAYESSVSPVVADEDRVSESIGTTLPAGVVVGYSDVDVMHTVEGPSFTFEMSGYVYGPGESDINEWTLGGEPELFLSNGVVPSYSTTCTQWVNRIPDVINARPGFVTVDELPPLRYRSMAMHHYVTTGRLT